ncbi:MAG: hypothetical protein H6737_30180 [Alphaproteobacteria bacterium]|nr:hypothetical protein [Alphaproteobacteria bacterium]
MWLLLAMLAGCQAPFGRDRHDLVGTRIAAVTAEVRGGFVEPRLALIVDGRPWSSEAAEIDWYWIDAVGDAADIPAGTFGVGLGPAPSFAVQGDRLAVLAVLGDEVLRAELDVTGRSEAEVRLTTARVDGVDVETVAGEDLALEVRRDWSATASHSVPPGGFARFTLEGVSDGLGRFMATGDGTFFELDHQTTDWVAGELVVDDLEIEERSVGEPGAITVVGVEIADSHSGFAATELFVGETPSGVWVANRFVPAEGQPTGRVWAVLAADDASPTGIALGSVEPADPTDTWDAETLDCAGVSGGAFDPTWLLEHRCTRDAIAGERVILEVDP